MAEQTRAKPSSPAKEVTVEQTGRRGRDATLCWRVNPTGAPIAGPPSEIAERTEEQSSGLTPVRTSGAIASEPAENAKSDAEQTIGSAGISNQLGGPTEAMAEQGAEKEKAIATEISAAPLHSPDAIAEAPSAVQQTTDDENLDVAMGSPESLPEESEEMKQTVTNQIDSHVSLVRWTYRSAKFPAEIRKTVSVESRTLSRLPSRDAITDEAIPEAVAQTSPDRPAPWEIERKLQLERGPQPTMQDVLAKWRDALWEALHGRWSEAVWEFARGAFHLLTQAATWRRVGKAVLNFLARFIPGHEPYVLRRSREIKELFRELHEEPKKPGTWSNCPK